MKCSNCTNAAKYVFKAPGVSDQPYCEQHLPAAYRNSDWVLPAPDGVLKAQSAVADSEPLAEVEEIPEVTDEEESAKPSRRTRKTAAEK